MSVKQYQRGHEMYFNYVKEEWFYSDDNSSTDIERPCTRCNHLPLENGEDYCLRELSNCKGITNACCGHGNDEHAYILLKDGRRFVLDKEFKSDNMNDIVFQDCEYRYIDENGEYQCKNSEYYCDNCKENIHLNCTNYNPRKDMCLKWFETDVSKKYSECREKTVFNDSDLQKKWSN